ncbi:MAG TPA: hypothetical protein VJM31_12555 [Vicinamibacterales bacterium]|nr:hypothetical protein [Vicinamibacterales bacterium]
MINDLLSVIPSWLNIALTFPGSPSKALQKYKGTGSVEKDLTLVALAGLAVAYVVLAVLIPVDLGDTKAIEGALGRPFDFKMLPMAILLGLVGAAVTLHIAGSLWLYAVRLVWKRASCDRMNGTVHDTVNAVLGLSAVVIPFIALVLGVVIVLGLEYKDQRTWWARIGALMIGAVIATYYPLAVSATHPDTPPHAAYQHIVAAFLLLSALGLAIDGLKSFIV